MSDGFDIQSHTGVYRANFDNGAVAALNAAVPTDAHFIVDRRIAGLYEKQLANVLASRSVLLVDATEENKSLDKFPAYVAHLVGKGLRRDHKLIAIGGGIIQDIACFLAATMLRGVEWIFYPTTLLAQADSCIGSKSSINSGDAKNILGTFTPPRQVFISTDFLATLDERDVRSGVGEMLKVHAIDGPDAFKRIAADYGKLFTDQAVMMRYIRDALEIKRRYIEEDEFDKGPRNIFNYGHSFGHAIEAATHFGIPHGIAVTIGMDVANFVASKLGVGTEGYFSAAHPCLRQNYRGFETHPVPIEPFLAALSKDKKNVGAGTATLILPDKEGRIRKGVYPLDDNFKSLCQTFLGEVRAA